MPNLTHNMYEEQEIVLMLCLIGSKIDIHLDNTWRPLFSIQDWSQYYTLHFHGQCIDTVPATLQTVTKVSSTWKMKIYILTINYGLTPKKKKKKQTILMRINYKVMFLFASMLTIEPMNFEVLVRH